MVSAPQLCPSCARLPMGCLSGARHTSPATRHNPLSRVRACLQNRLNELDENLAIEIRSW
jgi:hypothetical protein